jgi:hypothetical protein
MSMWVPESLRPEQIAVEADIRSAFKGVTREGGVSWKEAFAADVGSSPDKCIAARALDVERCWEDLIDDPNWYTDTGTWYFLDAIGFRYYLAAAMVRDCREAFFENSGDAFECRTFEEELPRLLTPAQHAAIRRFLEFIVFVQEAYSGEVCADLRELIQKWER